MFSSEVYQWKNEGVKELGKILVGIEDDSFEELCNDLIQKDFLDELYMDLSMYISL